MTAVVVLNWNGRDDTLRCLRSLDATRSEWSSCLVVDNGSLDGSVAACRREFPGVEILETGENLGYAGGNNAGLRHALAGGAEAIVVLNNDACVRPGTIAGLGEAIRADRSIGIAGPGVYHADGTLTSAGAEIVRRPFHARDVPDAARLDAPDPSDVGFVPGCALMVRREVLERIGLFDERFFLCWEDSDLGARAARAGFRNVVVPRTAVTHDASSSFAGTFSPLYSYYYFRNMLLYAHVHFAPRERPAAYRDAVRHARRVVRRRRHPGDGLVPAIALGFVHFALGRYGRAPSRLTSRSSRGRAEAVA